VYKRGIRILSVVVKYSMCGLICDVISYCASSFAMGKLSEYDDRIVIKSLKMKDVDIKQTFM